MELIKVPGWNIFVISGNVTVLLLKIQASWDDMPC